MKAHDWRMTTRRLVRMMPIMPIRITVLAAFLSAAAACSSGPYAEPSDPDASPTSPADAGHAGPIDAALPSCASVGCAGDDLLCTRAGVCECPQAAGPSIPCQDPPRGFVDAAVDAGKISTTDAETRIKPDASPSGRLGEALPNGSAVGSDGT